MVASPDQSDGDWVGDACDMCPETPSGVRVDSDGGPVVDLDSDCDADLEDYSVFPNSFIGPG